MTEFTPVPEWQMWLWDAAFSAIRIYFWLLMAVGVGVCLKALRKTGNKGYILIALFFVAPVIGLGLRAVSHRIYRAQTVATDAQITARSLSVTRKDVSFPLFETLLVLGLILVTKDKRLSNQRPENNAREVS